MDKKIEKYVDYASKLHRMVRKISINLEEIENEIEELIRELLKEMPDQDEE